MIPVVITGRGLITPIGMSLAENLESLKTGKSGITRIPYWQELNLDSQVAGAVNLEGFECPAFDRKQIRFMTQSGVMAVAAAYEAITEAGYTMQDLPGSKMAVITGCGGSSYSEYYKSIMTYERTHSTRKISPFSIPRIMPSSAVANLSLVYKIGGESYDVSCACTSGAVALIQAIRLIQSGAYDIVMAGGCEELSWQQALGFGAMHALSSNFNEEPEKASRPFDRQRTGFVLSEAAGIVILESEAHAKARGAKIRGRISGYACNSNACDMVAPSREVSAAVMSDAIANASLKPSDIDYVNTHGTGTPVGDPEGRVPRMRRVPDDQQHQVPDRPPDRSRRRDRADLLLADDRTFLRQPVRQRGRHRGIHGMGRHRAHPAPERPRPPRSQQQLRIRRHQRRDHRFQPRRLRSISCPPSCIRRVRPSWRPLPGIPTSRSAA